MQVEKFDICLNQSFTLRMPIQKCLVSLGIFLLPSLVWAYGMDDFEMGHVLSVGAGVSSPSVTSALGENPAGLMYNQQTKFLGEAALTNHSLNNLGMGGLFYLGNGFVGGGLGIETFNGQGNNAGSLTLLNFGVGALIEGLNLSFGASGTYTVSQNGATNGTGSGSIWTGNIGLLYNPNGPFRVGATAFHLASTDRAIGLGLAADASTWATFALDGTMNMNGTGPIIKPAMGIHLKDFQCTLGYGLPLDSTATNWIRQGGSLGVGVRLSMNFHLQAYYNHLALYYFGLTIRI